MPLEILSPAGSFEAMQAAVRAGADAVYFGTGELNARRNAKNISADELSEALRYCRLRGVKTYVTVNTLVTDRELEAACGLVSRLSELGADAVIVQDLGMVRMMRALAPDLPLHGSTQMTVHSLGGVLSAQRLGLSRVVLSRELPLEQIRFICERSPIEIEVFCHGALCMSYSGQCYLSSAIGGRSGNRGLCAQPCRMNYSFFGGTPSPLLSLKDLSAAGHLGELERAGVCCLKIEGRMKRPEYVALATKTYKDAVREGREPTAREMELLRAVFSRGGFTDGYLTGKKGEGMFGVRDEQSARQAREVYQKAQEIYTAQPEPPCVMADMEFCARAGGPVRLSVRDEDGFEYRAEGLAPEPARTRATTADEVESGLRKTGGTVFAPRRVSVELDEGLRVPMSAVNALRRRCLDGLAAVRAKPPERRAGQWQPGLHRGGNRAQPGYIVSCLRLEQVTPALLDLHPDWLYLPLREAAKHKDAVRALARAGQKVAAVLDRITFDSEWPGQIELLRACREAGVSALVCGNLAHAALLGSLGFELRGDFGLGVMNSQTLKELKALGFCSATLSFELSFARIRAMSHGMPTELIAYGRLPLMVTENCVIRRRSGECTCSPERGEGLIDKTGRSFPLFAESGHRNTLYNADKLYLADKADDLRTLGVSHLRLSFTTENARDCRDIAAAYMLGENIRLPERMTRGLYYRGVE